LWFIEDWRLDDEGRITGGFGNRMEAGMSGRIGNTVTLNGRVREAVSVKAGERVRLRIVNAALARIIGLRFEGHKPIIVAHDGQPSDPYPPDGGRVMLGPAMRADLILDMNGTPGQTYRVIDDFYPDFAYKLADLAYDPGKPARDPRSDAPPKLPTNPLPEPDLAAAERHQIALQGGMMGGMGMMGRSGMMGGMGTMGDDATWAMNGMSMTGDGQLTRTGESHRRRKMMQISNYKRSRRATLTFLVGGAALIGGATGVIPLGAEPTSAGGDVTLYKNPQCDCCEGYADYLRHHGLR